LLITTLQERSKAERINRKLRQQLADFRVPEVMEYVSEKADLYELQKKVKSWERKVEIADVSTGLWFVKCSLRLVLCAFVVLLSLYLVWAILSWCP